MKKKFFYIFIIIMLCGIKLLPQSLINVQFRHIQKPSYRRTINIPDIMGFQTLKCDFHMHTVFSDGSVWPTVRIDEAWEEGLDAISITDHVENQPSKKYITGDHNSSYELAEDYALEKNIILVRGGEITRSMPPGHLNALFLSDVNLLDVPDVTEALLAAKKQGAFILWNHPGWKAQQPDTCRWMPMHEKLFGMGLINGIEVFNEQEYYPVALDWCLNRNITVLCNSDIHGITANFYKLESGHRPMTLVFARTRTAESIREALFKQQTVAFFDNTLAGKEEYLKAIVNASLLIANTGIPGGKNGFIYELTNSSDIPFTLVFNGKEPVTIPANGSISLTLNNSDLAEVSIRNLITGSGSILKMKLNP
jgi:hypothetical protein